MYSGIRKPLGRVCAMHIYTMLEQEYRFDAPLLESITVAIPVDTPCAIEEIRSLFWAIVIRFRRLYKRNSREGKFPASKSIRSYIRNEDINQIIDCYLWTIENDPYLSISKACKKAVDLEIHLRKLPPAYLLTSYGLAKDNLPS